MKNLTKVLITCFVSIMAVNANAAIINGSFAVNGGLDTGGSDLANVTAISLIDVFGANGTGDTDDVDFFSTASTSGNTISLFSFQELTGANFISIEGWNLDLKTLNVIEREIGLLTLKGAGLLSGARAGTVYESTNATWEITTTSANSYGMTVTAVPVPAAVWLFGSGLIGLVGIARRKV